MIGWALAHAGELRTDEFTVVLDDARADTRALVTVERGRFALSCTVCLPEPLAGADPSAVARGIATERCGMDGYRVVAEGAYAHILPPADDGPLLLDRVVALPPGRRDALAFAAELQGLLNVPLGPKVVVSTGSWGRPYWQVDVPVAEPQSVRSWLRATVVPPRDTFLRSYPHTLWDGALVWETAEWDSARQALFLSVLDRTKYPPPADDYPPEPPPPSKLQWLEAKLAEAKAHPERAAPFPGERELEVESLERAIASERSRVLPRPAGCLELTWE